MENYPTKHTLGEQKAKPTKSRAEIKDQRLGVVSHWKTDMLRF
jgi:hypothetical protein